MKSFKDYNPENPYIKEAWEDEEDEDTPFFGGPPKGTYKKVYNRHTKETLWHAKSKSGGISVHDTEEKAKKAAMKEETQHKVNVTVSDPNHTMATKRKEEIQKRVIVNANDKEHAIVKAKEFYKKKGYKVHSAEYHSRAPKSSMN